MNGTLSAVSNASDASDVQLLTTSVMRYISFAIGSVGLTGNAFVVVVIVSAAAMRKQLTNAYIINQSLVDGTVSLMLLMTTVFEDDGRTFDSPFDDAFCRLWLTKLWLWGFYVSSTYNLLALTLERYLAVVHPIWHKMKLTKAKVAASVVFVWIFGPAYNAAYMIPTAGITASGHCTVYSMWPDALTQHAVGVLTIIVQFIGPLCLLIFFYARMIVVLRRRVAPEASSATSDGSVRNRKQDTMARARKNILKTLSIVAFCFVFCWTWNQIYFLLYNLGWHGVDFAGLFYNYTVVMVFMNCCVNPFIYIAKYEQFQRTMKRLFCRRTTAGAEETQICNSSIEH